MRLTPFRFRSSSGDEERPSATDVRLDVEIYRPAPPEDGRSEADGSRPDPSNPDLDVAATLEDLDTPATVDEIVDRLLSPDEAADVERWADVHERLSRTELPALDAAGTIEFDPETGVVDRPEADPAESNDSTAVRAVAAAGSLALFGTLLALLSPLTATLTAFTLVSLAVAVYVPARFR